MRKAFVPVMLLLILGVGRAQIGNPDHPTMRDLGLHGPVETMDEYSEVVVLVYGKPVYQSKELFATYTFDRQGHILSRVAPIGGKLRMKTYRYGRDGRLLEVVSRGDLIYTVKAHYPNPNQVVYDRFNEAGAQTARTVYTFDDRGRVMKRELFNSGGAKTTEDRFKTNPVGWVTQLKRFSEDGLDHVENMSYTSQGWLDVYNYGDGVVKHQYPTLDAHGNWLEQITLQKEQAFGETTWKPIWRETREITYWP